MSNNFYSNILPFAGNGLYVHVPFCLSKCDYCGFYSVLPEPGLIDKYLQRLAEEAVARLADCKPDFKTVFIGGGNPTALGVENLRQLVNTLQPLLHDYSAIQEWTFESNPETLTPEIVDFLGTLPKIRLSMGIQRLSDRELGVLGRRADIDSVYRALDMAFASLQNIGGDFIMGVPGCNSLAEDLGRLLEKFPFKHVSSYFLTVEEDTPMQRYISSGQMPDPGDVDAAELFEIRDVLAGSGFEHYEISNYARPGWRCLHNLNYWQPGSYSGLGPSAVSTFGGTRLTNPADIKRWLAGEAPAVEQLSPTERRNEYLMLRLRLLVEGLDIAGLERRFGAQDSEFYQSLVEQIDNGRLIRDENRVRLTDQGIAVADEVMASLFI
jgi:oxygen-independent coproporphyrinogen III oxidase